MKKGENKKGFTLIEVVLVLAVAGLIFLMVFIALPALQRSQRDTQRREDMFRLIAAIKKYQQNNRGATPTDYTASGDLRKNYLKNFVDPDGTSYNFAYVDCTKESTCAIDDINKTDNKTFPNGHKITIIKGATCDGLPVTKSDNARKVAVVYKLEGGGTYCGTT